MHLILRVLLLLPICIHSAFATDFLPADQAFSLKTNQESGQIQLHWQIEHGYYLYKQRISAFFDDEQSEETLHVTFHTESTIKEDRNFGKVPVFYDAVDATINLGRIDSQRLSSNDAQISDNEQNGHAAANRILIVEYQGCAKNGLCYQPQLREINLDAETFTHYPLETSTDTKANIEQSPDKGLSFKDLGSSQSVAGFLRDANLATTIGIFLLLGIGLSLTPCILPMIPILSGVIVGQGEQLTTARGVTLSTSYVLGMSVAYAVAGVAAASLGAQGNLQMYMQNPWVLSAFALVFVVLALSMFGLYTLQLPSVLQNKLYGLSSKQQGGHFFGVFVMGALSALVVSPCVSAPLAGTLVYISSTGNLLLGGAALFALGLGMGLPLIAIGAGGGKLVPKAGVWMNNVKVFFGVVLLGVAIWLIARIVSDEVSLALWAILLISYAIYAGALDAAELGIARLRKAVSFVVLIFGSVLLVNAINSEDGAMTNLQAKPSRVSVSEASTLFHKISDGETLQLALDTAVQSGQPVILDFYADWCTSCIEMEKHVFHKSEVREALQPFVALQIDVTRNSEDQRKILDKYGLYGPPSLLFFNTQGEEISPMRIQGDMDAQGFMKHIGIVLSKFMI